MSEQSTAAPIELLPITYRDIPGFPGYRAGTDGSIWSCLSTFKGHTRPWKKRKPVLNCHGYPTLRIVKGGCAEVGIYVHKLVALAFLGPPPDGLEVCHENGIPTDCRPVNLRYDTHQANAQDALRHGTIPLGSQRPGSRLTEDQVREMRATHASGVMGYKNLGRKFGVHTQTVAAIIRRKTWKHI